MTAHLGVFPQRRSGEKLIKIIFWLITVERKVITTRMYPGQAVYNEFTLLNTVPLLAFVHLSGKFQSSLKNPNYLAL